jgi:transposase
MIDALKTRLEPTKDGISRQSPLVDAINCTLDQWSGLTLFLEDGRLEPDTNTVERSIRSTSIGKKNRLSAAMKAAARPGQSGRHLNTAKLNGADSQTYLTEILERGVSGETTKINQLHDLLVWNWKAARESEKAAA